MTDLRKAAEMALEALLNYPLTERRAIQALRQALAQPEQGEVVVVKNPQGQIVAVTRQDEDGRILKTIATSAQPEQEPVWTIEECDRTVKTLRYIQGIAERGEGRAMREDESLEQFLLSYVQKLEKQQDIKTQTVRVLTEQCATLIQERDDLQKEVWSNKDKALAQPEQEPVARAIVRINSICPDVEWYPGVGGRIDDGDPLYTAPPKREWVGLTDAQISLMISTHKSLTDLCRSIEAKLKEKNS